MNLDFRKLALRDRAQVCAIAICLMGLLIVLVSAIVPSAWSHISPTHVMVGQEWALPAAELAKVLDYTQLLAILGFLMMVGGAITLRRTGRENPPSKN